MELLYGAFFGLRARSVAPVSKPGHFEIARFWNWENETVCGVKLSPSVTSVTHPRPTRQAPEMVWKLSSSLCTTLRAGSNPRIWLAYQGYKCSSLCIQRLVYIYKWRLLFGTKITIFIGVDSEHTYLLIVGGDELAVFGPGIHSEDIETPLAISASRNLVSHLFWNRRAAEQPPRFRNRNGQSFQFRNRQILKMGRFGRRRFWNRSYRTGPKTKMKGSEGENRSHDAWLELIS